jgi:hypothetical protein
MTHVRPVGRRLAVGIRVAIRTCATLVVAAVFAQGVSAGEILGGFPAAVGWHAAGAVAVQVLTAVTALAAFAWWWLARGPRWPVVLAAVVFVGSVAQAIFGAGVTLTVHVPLALLLMIGACLVAAWAWLDRGPVRPR